MRSYFRFVADNRYMLLFGCLCVFWGNFGQSFFLGWYGDAIMRDLGLSAKEYGSVYALATLGSGLSLMWVGGFIDKWPLLRFVGFVGLGLVSACIVLSQAHAIWVLVLGFYLVRLFGQGLLPHAGVTTMAKVFDENRGKAISLAVCGVPLGEILLPASAVFLIASLGWQNSWWVVALGTVLVFLPLCAWLLRCSRHEAPSMSLGQNAGNGGSRSGRWLVLRDHRFWFAAPTLLACPFMITGIFFHQGFVLTAKAWPSEWMALAFVVYGICHWASSMLFGILVDRFGGIRLLRFYNLPLLLGVVLLANVPGLWVAPVMMALLGTAIGAASPTVGAMWAEVYGTDVIGGVRSAVSSIVVLSTAASPYIFGVLIDSQTALSSMMNGFALFFFAALVLLCFSYAPHPRQSQ